MSAPRTMYRQASRSLAATRADRLRDLARRVERLGSGWRHDPEQVLDAKATISAELRSLAREFDARGDVP